MPKILVVDDDPNIALLIQMTLAKLGAYDVETVNNGEEALNRIAESPPPDIVLLDIMMPGIDGFEVCRRIKSNEKTKFIPVIMITAKREMDDKLYGMEIGANDYITKPFNPEELVTRVKVHLRIKNLEKEIAAKQELEAALKMSVTLQHEINNPLTGIIGNAEFLQEWETASPNEIKQAAEDILNLSLRIKGIVHQLSQVSRVVATPYVGGREMLDMEKSTSEKPPTEL